MKITDTEVHGFKMAITGMRNPLNSWHLSDSQIVNIRNNSKQIVDLFKDDKNYNEEGFLLGEDDLDLAQRLIKSGSEHMKFMRQIHVWANIDMPRYWWSEEDTYNFNTKNSCSTMHKLLNNKNEITRNMFVYCEEDIDIVDMVIKRLNELRVEFLETKNDHLVIRAKRLLMEGFLQYRTMDSNYAEIRNEYHQRKHHRLKEEWQNTFCKWVESLPYAEELILYNPKESN